MDAVNATGTNGAGGAAPATGADEGLSPEVSSKLINLSTSDSELMALLQDPKNTDSFAKQTAFQKGMEQRSKIESLISNVMKAIGEAARNVINNMK